MLLCTGRCDGSSQRCSRSPRCSPAPLPAAAYHEADLRADARPRDARAARRLGRLRARPGHRRGAATPCARTRAASRPRSRSSSRRRRRCCASGRPRRSTTRAVIAPDAIVDAGRRRCAATSCSSAAATRSSATRPPRSSRKRVRAAGIRRIDGAVVGDESALRPRCARAAARGYDPDLGGVLSALAYDRGIFRGRARLDAARFAAAPLRRAAASRRRDSDRQGRAPAPRRQGAEPIAFVAVAARRRADPLRQRAVEQLRRRDALQGARRALRRRAARRAAGADVVRDTLDDFGVRPRIVDGSGLSRSNRATPREVVRLLERMHNQDIARRFRASLAVAGRDGHRQGAHARDRGRGPLPRQDRHAAPRQRAGGLLPHARTGATSASRSCSTRRTRPRRRRARTASRRDRAAEAELHRTRLRAGRVAAALRRFATCRDSRLTRDEGASHARAADSLDARAAAAGAPRGASSRLRRRRRGGRATGARQARRLRDHGHRGRRDEEGARVSVDRQGRPRDDDAARTPTRSRARRRSCGSSATTPSTRSVKVVAGRTATEIPSWIQDGGGVPPSSPARPRAPRRCWRRAATCIVDDERGRGRGRQEPRRARRQGRVHRHRRAVDAELPARPATLTAHDDRRGDKRPTASSSRASRPARTRCTSRTPARSCTTRCSSRCARARRSTRPRRLFASDEPPERPAAGRLREDRRHAGHRRRDRAEPRARARRRPLRGHLLHQRPRGRQAARRQGHDRGAVTVA